MELDPGQLAGLVNDLVANGRPEEAELLVRRGLAHYEKLAKASPGQAEHPILRGIADGDIWGPTDVYGVTLPLPGDSQPLVLGQVLTGMHPTDSPVAGKQNEPMMPVAWVKTFKAPSGKTARVFTTTMGASQDLESEGLRRLLVNACYWAVGLEDAIALEADVALVGEYRPRPFGFGTFAKGVRPAELAADRN